MEETNTEVLEEEIVEEEVETFTKDEVEKMLQSEADKRVSTALKTAKEKWEQEYTSKLETEKSEAEKLAKLSEEERFQVKLNQEKEQFENERKEFMKHKMELQTVKELQANDLPVEFADYLVAEDAESVRANIETFKTAWVSVLENAVEERLKGKTPTQTNKQQTTLTKEEFANLSYNERLALFKENPELYKQLTK